MPMGEHISTQRQGRYVYDIFVAGSGGHWEWQVARLLASASSVRGPSVADGLARSRDDAITAAQAACRNAMEKNRASDWRP